MKENRICKDCDSFGVTDDEEATVCLAGAGLVCKDTQSCIYFVNINKIANHETLEK